VSSSGRSPSAARTETRAATGTKLLIRRGFAALDRLRKARRHARSVRHYRLRLPLVTRERLPPRKRTGQIVALYEALAQPYRPPSWS